MEIMFKRKQFEKRCNEFKSLKRHFGEARAIKIRLRLDEFAAADNLEIIRALPSPRCHELTGNRKGQLTVDLDQPYRLVFEPANYPIHKKPDGGLDWSKVTAVLILGVEDTHE